MEISSFVFLYIFHPEFSRVYSLSSLKKKFKGEYSVQCFIIPTTVVFVGNFHFVLGASVHSVIMPHTCSEILSYFNSAFKDPYL